MWLSRYALLSASDKSGAVEFASELIKLDWGIYSLRGTAKVLEQHEIRFEDLSRVVGPSILGGRVSTLSTEIHDALLTRPASAAVLSRDTLSDHVDVARLGINPIGLVYVNFYPLEQELQSTKATFDSVVEQIDIGGPALVFAAIKGGRIVVTSKDQFGEVLAFLRQRSKKPRSLSDQEEGAFVLSCAARAAERVVSYQRLVEKFLKEYATTCRADLVREKLHLLEKEVGCVFTK